MNAPQLSLALLALLAAGCSAPRIWTTQRLGPVEVDGSISVTNGGAGASSSADALGLERDDSSWSPRVDLDLASMHVNAGRFASHHEGTGRAEATLSVGGSTINANDTVNSMLDLELTTVAITFDFVPTEVLDVGLGIGGGVLEYDAFFQSTTTSQIVESNESVPVGFLAGRVASRLGDFLLSVDLAGLEISLDDDELMYLDADAAVAWSFFDPVGPGFGELVLGYRHIQTDIEVNESNERVDADLDFSGAYVGLSIGL